MAKYAVTYEEVYQKTFIVEADSPEEDECTDEENEVYAECQNLKEALEELNDRRHYL